MRKEIYYLLSSFIAFNLAYSQPKFSNNEFLSQKNNLENIINNDFDDKTKDKLQEKMEYIKKNSSIKLLYFLRGINSKGTAIAGGLLTNDGLFEYGVSNEIRKITRIAKNLFSEQYIVRADNADTNIAVSTIYLRGIHKKKFGFLGNLCEFGGGLNIKGWFYNTNKLMQDSVYKKYNYLQGKFDEIIGEPYYVTKSFLDYTELTAGPSIYLRILPGNFDGDGLFNIRGIIDLNLPVFNFRRRKPDLTFEIGLMIIPPFSRR